jgi:hypothetical protein
MLLCSRRVHGGFCILQQVLQAYCKTLREKGEIMNAKKIGILALIVAVLSIGVAQNSFKGIGKPLPKPAPTSCPSDMLCW